LLRAAAYDLELRFGDTRYARPSLLAVAADWRYVGVLHEYLQSPRQTDISKLSGPWIEVRPEGARSRNPRKFHDDAALLEAALIDEPDNSRYWFYLGQSYRDAGELPAALRAYRRRAELAGWDEETWYTHLQIALLLERLAGAEEFQQIQAAFDIAYQYRPSRAETLVELARWHRQQGRYAQALLYARGAVQIPPTTDRLFVDHSAYSWRAWDEYSISAFYCQCLAEGAFALKRLLAAEPPKEHLPRILENAGHYQRQGWVIETGAVAS
jgi:tetratricopeptide (TPR) repeat protein